MILKFYFKLRAKKPRIWREQAVPCAYGMPQEISEVLSTYAIYRRHG